MNRSDEITEGWVITLIEKNAGTRAMSYPCIDAACERWAREAYVAEWKSLDEMIDEAYSSPLKGEASDDEKQAAREAVKNAGIADGQPFIAFNPINGDGYDLAVMDFLPVDTPKRELLKAMIHVDARNSEIWEAVEGETRGEFIGRILANTRCHSLRAGALYQALRVDERR